MPLGNRNIEPTCLGAHEVPQETESEKKSCLLAVANNAIVGTLLQLSSLVRHADDLFCDISDECQKVLERTDSLSTRIRKVDDVIGKLDAKQVAIPEGNLREFTSVSNHHAARHGYDAHLFIPTNRPQCLADQYNLCAPNPTRVIRSADRYRKDGLSGSKMFKCWPVIMQEQTVRTPDLNMPRRIQRVCSFEKKYKPPRVRPKTIHGWDGLMADDEKKSSDNSGDKHRSSECLITNEPPVVVTIDTSGSNFERMQSIRLSGRRSESKEERDKKKRRRRTVSGVPENLMSEIERFDRSKRKHLGQPRRTPRSYSFDDLDADDGDLERDEGIVKYLDELDGRREERLEEEKAQKKMKFFPCRRSRSLPRCIKLVSVTRSLSSDRKSQRDMNTTYESSSLSIASLASNASSRLSRATKRSSMLSHKLKSLVGGNVKDKPKPRPKSLDIDTFLDSKHENKHSIAVQGRSKSTYSLERNHSQSVPQNLLSTQCSQKSDSTIGPGSYYNFESSTLPRAQAKKYDFPWESLPKDWTTSVKLREISKRRSKEDRQSSSGNWSQSGTSSNRHSLDSDLRSGSEGPKFNSQYSLGKDSGRDSLTLEEENDCVTDTTSTAGYAADGTSTIVGSTDSVSVGNPKSDFTELDTEAWIQSLAVRAAKQEQADSATLSRLTRQNIIALDLMLCDETTRKKTEDESSQFSVDQEGFFTSFHNDSGLKKSTNTLVDEDEDYSPTKDTISVCSADSVIHRPDKSDKFANLRKGSSSNQKVLSKVTPPTAPNQSPSDADISSEGKDSSSSPELKSFPSQDSSSVSESDAEAVFTRVHDKTNLSSTGFPSYVALSTSDDESSPDSGLDKARQRNCHAKGLDYNQTVSETGLNSDFAYISHGDGRFLSSSGSAEKFSPLEPSLKHSQSVLECTQQGYEPLTQLKGQHNQRPKGLKSETSYQSWPRSHKSTPTSGILKTPEKQPDPARPQKSLNFAPVLNLFNPGAAASVQMPLPSPTNSSSSECSLSGPAGPFLQSFQSPASQDQSYQLTVPIQNKQKPKQKSPAPHKSNLPMKYQPVITVTPRSRSGDRQGSDRSRSGPQSKTSPDNPDGPIYAKAHPKAQSTPHSTSSTSPSQPGAQMLYAVSPVLAQKHAAQQGSSTAHNRDSGYMDMQSVGSLRSAESNSSLASSDCLSFSDQSHYMSMSSPSSSPNLSNMEFSISSTPSGSMDSLLDMRKTPTNELDTDTYHINTSLHYNNHHGKAGQVETVPIVTQGNTPPVNMSRQTESQQAMSSFRTPELKSADSSFSSYKSGRRSVDSADLTRVTQMSLDSSRGSSAGSPATREVPSKQAGRQQGRQSRTDTRHEPSYRSHNASNRRSLPADASNHISYTTKHVPLKDKGYNNNTGAKTDNKSLSSSKSCPTGFNAMTSVNAQHAPQSRGQTRTSQGPHHAYGRQPASTSSVNQSVSGNGDRNASMASHRSDSYRVAMASENVRNGSYRVAMHQSKSFPVLPPSQRSGPYRVAMDMSPHKPSVDDDVMSRADSYRIAVRNTQGLVEPGDTTYRMAVDQDSSSGVSMKFKTLNLNNHKTAPARDTNRRSAAPDRTKELISKPVLQETKSAPNTTSSGRIRKSTKQDVDPIQVVQTVDNNNETKRSNKNNQNRSSTYIQFDPIFEDLGEDFPVEALRQMSNAAVDMDMSSMDYSANISNISKKSKYGLVNGNAKDANANHVKVAKKSKSGKNVEIEDDLRFSQV